MSVRSDGLVTILTIQQQKKSYSSGPGGSSRGRGLERWQWQKWLLECDGCGLWSVTWRMQSQNYFKGEFEVRLTCECEVEVRSTPKALSLRTPTYAGQLSSWLLDWINSWSLVAEMNHWWQSPGRGRHAN